MTRVAVYLVPCLLLVLSHLVATFTASNGSDRPAVGTLTHAISHHAQDTKKPPVLFGYISTTPRPTQVPKKPPVIFGYSDMIHSPQRPSNRINQPGNTNNGHLHGTVPHQLSGNTHSGHIHGTVPHQPSGNAHSGHIHGTVPHQQQLHTQNAKKPPIIFGYGDVLQTPLLPSNRINQQHTSNIPHNNHHGHIHGTIPNQQQQLHDYDSPHIIQHPGSITHSTPSHSPPKYRTRSSSVSHSPSNDPTPSHSHSPSPYRPHNHSLDLRRPAFYSHLHDSYSQHSYQASSTPTQYSHTYASHPPTRTVIMGYS